MKTSQLDVSPNADGQSRPTPTAMEDLKKLSPRTALVTLCGTLARRKAKDAQAAKSPK